jgi:probable HAF family extracellular repeat protein
MTTLIRYLPLFALTLLMGGCGGGGAQQSGEPTAGAATSAYTLPEASDADYAITVLGGLGTESWGVSINESGQVAGNYYDAYGQLHVFLWRDGQMRPLVASAQAAALNDAGQVVGWLESSAGPQAFLHDGDLLRVAAAAPFSRAYALNNGGTIAGHLRFGSEQDQAFVEEGGQMSFPAAFAGFAARINDSGQVALQQLHHDGGVGAWLLTDSHLLDLGTLGGRKIHVRGMNEAGTVVGWATTAAGAYHAFRWQNGQLLDLGEQIGESFCTAVAVNNRGQILLRATTLSGYRHYLWQEGQVKSLGNFGGLSAMAMDFNDQGQIVGWLEVGEGELRAFLATPKGAAAVAATNK